MTPEPKPPILTLKMARMIAATSCCKCACQLADSLSDDEVEAIEALATGTAKVVPVRSEAEEIARCSVWRQCFIDENGYAPTPAEIWLAATRDA